jgi:hypothetical protein
MKTTSELCTHFVPLRHRHSWSGRKFKLFPCVIMHYERNRYWGVEVQLHISLLSTLDEYEWPASLSRQFTPGKKHARPPIRKAERGTELFRTIDRKEQLFAAVGSRIPIPPPYITQPYHYTDWAIPALRKYIKQNGWSVRWDWSTLF